jgi:hypothetical protein
MTVEQFERQYGHEKPYFEYWFGQPVQKAMPTWIHSMLQKIIMRLLDDAGYESGAEVLFFPVRLNYLTRLGQWRLLSKFCLPTTNFRRYSGSASSTAIWESRTFTSLIRKRDKFGPAETISRRFWPIPSCLFQPRQSGRNSTGESRLHKIPSFGGYKFPRFISSAR